MIDRHRSQFVEEDPGAEARTRAFGCSTDHRAPATARRRAGFRAAWVSVSAVALALLCVVPSAGQDGGSPRDTSVAMTIEDRGAGPEVTTLGEATGDAMMTHELPAYRGRKVTWEITNRTNERIVVTIQRFYRPKEWFHGPTKRDDVQLNDDIDSFPFRKLSRKLRLAVPAGATASLVGRVKKNTPHTRTYKYDISVKGASGQLNILDPEMEIY